MAEHFDPDFLGVLASWREDDVWSEGFLPELQRQFERRGVRPTVYTQNPQPPECRYRVRYTPTGVGTWPCISSTRRSPLFGGSTPIGAAIYDARWGNLRWIDKHGRTASKLNMIMGPLLAGAHPAEGAAAKPSEGSGE